MAGRDRRGRRGALEGRRGPTEPPPGSRRAPRVRPRAMSGSARAGTAGIPAADVHSRPNVRRALRRDARLDRLGGGARLTRGHRRIPRPARPSAANGSATTTCCGTASGKSSSRRSRSWSRSFITTPPAGSRVTATRAVRCAMPMRPAPRETSRGSSGRRRWPSTTAAGRPPCRSGSPTSAPRSSQLIDRQRWLRPACTRTRGAWPRRSAASPWPPAGADATPAPAPRSRSCARHSAQAAPRRWSPTRTARSRSCRATISGGRTASSWQGQRVPCSATKTQRRSSAARSSPPSVSRHMIRGCWRSRSLPSLQRTRGPGPPPTPTCCALAAPPRSTGSRNIPGLRWRLRSVPGSISATAAGTMRRRRSPERSASCRF